MSHNQKQEAIFPLGIWCLSSIVRNPCSAGKYQQVFCWYTCWIVQICLPDAVVYCAWFGWGCSSSGTRAASKRRLGNATSVTVLWTHVKTPTDGRDVTGGWRNRPGSIKARAVEPASAFVIQQPLCVCLSISVGAYFCWLCLTDTQDKLHDSYKCKVLLALGECGSHYRLCVPPCKRKAFSAGD